MGAVRQDETQSAWLRHREPQGGCLNACNALSRLCRGRWQEDGGEALGSREAAQRPAPRRRDGRDWVTETDDAPPPRRRDPHRGGRSEGMFGLHRGDGREERPIPRRRCTKHTDLG